MLVRGSVGESSSTVVRSVRIASSLRLGLLSRRDVGSERLMSEELGCDRRRLRTMRVEGMMLLVLLVLLVLMRWMVMMLNRLMTTLVRRFALILRRHTSTISSSSSSVRVPTRTTSTTSTKPIISRRRTRILRIRSRLIEQVTNVHSRLVRSGGVCRRV